MANERHADERQPMYCTIDGRPIKEHPKCEACSIFVGPGHNEKILMPFMGHMICGGCLNSKRGEFARDWEEFVHGVPIERMVAHTRKSLQEVHMQLAEIMEGFRRESEHDAAVPQKHS